MSARTYNVALTQRELNILFTALVRTRDDVNDCDDGYWEDETPLNCAELDALARKIVVADHEEA